VITARAPGLPVGSLVRAAVRRSTDAATLARAAVACTAAGAWLRRFQAAGMRAVQGQRSAHLSDFQAWLDYLDERLRWMCRARPAIEPSLRTRLLAHAASTLHALPDRALDCVTWSHGDFGPHNILLDHDTVTILDLELAPQHPYFDAAYFVEALALHHGPLVDPTRVQRLERAFLAGAALSGEEPLFRLFRLRHVLCAYVSETRRHGVAHWKKWSGLLAMRSRVRRFPQALPLRAARRAA
jgi:Ser/Thr protein kinase RdoA (MazF antagonist)